MDHDLDSHLAELVSKKVAHIVSSAEDSPEYQAVISQLTRDFGRENAEKVFAFIRTTSTCIYEHCYLSGMRDGLILVKRIRKK